MKLARIGAAALVPTNIVQVDMFLWKFETPKRRKWLIRDYALLTTGRRPALAVSEPSWMPGRGAARTRGPQVWPRHLLRQRNVCPETNTDRPPRAGLVKGASFAADANEADASFCEM